MKKILAIALTCAMVLALFAGCGGSSAPAATNAPATTAAPAATQAPAEPRKWEGVELTFWSLWNAPEPQAQVISEAAAAFEEQTGAKINVEFKGRDLNQILSASLEAGDKVDIYEDDYQRIAMNYAKYTADLTEMAKAAGYASYEFLDNQVIEWVGYLNSVVEQPQIGGIFYNKDAFDKAGITGTPKTWTEFLDVCAKLKAAGIEPLALDSGYAYFTYYNHLVRHLGEDAIKELALNGGWGKSAGAVQSAQDIIDLVNAGYLVEGSPSEYPSGQNKVGFGQAGMIVLANYVVGEVNAFMGEKGNWGLFPYPNVEGGAGNDAYYIGSNSIAITDYCPNKEAAFDFLMFLTTGEYDQKMADTAMQIPADPSNVCNDIPGAVEIFKGAKKGMSWCASTNANSDLQANFKTMFREIYEGKYPSGQAFCDALDALYK